MRAQYPEGHKTIKEQSWRSGQVSLCPKSCLSDGEAGSPREADRAGEEEKEDTEQGAG